MAFNPSKVNPSITDIEEFQTIEGEKYGIAFASVTAPNDDWLVSPKLRMPEEEAKMTFFVKSLSPAPELADSYRILVSTTGNNPEDFTAITETMEAAITWESKEIDLSEYNGKDIYIAIQCLSDNKKGLLVDDIRISRPGSSGIEDDATAGMTLYPNPTADILFIDGNGTQMTSAEIFNETGNLVYHSNNATCQYRISVDQLEAGIYFVRIISENGTKVMKFIVNR